MAKKSILEEELASVKKIYEGYLYPLYDSFWKAYLKDDSDRAGFVRDWQTNVFTSMTQKSIDVMYASIYDAQVGYTVSGRNTEGVKNAKNMRKYLDYIFDQANGRRVIEDVSLDAMVTGTGFVKTYWEEYKKTVKRMNRKTGKVEDIVYESKNLPSMVSVSPYNILIDPNARDIESAKFIYEVSHSNLDVAWIRFGKMFEIYRDDSDATKEAFSAFIDSKVKASTGDGNKKEEKRMRNYEDIRSRIFLAKGAREAYKASIGKGAGNTPLPNTVQPNPGAAVGSSLLNIDLPDAEYEFIERWTDTQYTLLVNSIELFSIENPLPFKGHPYSQVFFKRIPRTTIGVGIAYTIHDFQDMDNMLVNLKIDSAKIYSTPTFTRRRSEVGGDLYDGNDFLDISPGKVIPVREENEIQPLFKSSQAGNMNIAREQMMELDAAAKEAVGLNEYVLGSQGKVERSAAAVKTLIESFKMRLRPFISSINAAFSSIAKKWMAMTLAWGDDEIIVSVVGDGSEEILSYKIEDVVGEYKFSFSLEGMVSLTKEIEKEQMTNLLPVLINMAYDQKTQEAIVDQKKLMSLVVRMYDIDPDDVLAESVPDIGEFGDNDATKMTIEELMDIAPPLLPPQDEATQGIPQEVQGQENIPPAIV